MVTCPYWSNAYSKGHWGNNNKNFIQCKYMWSAISGIAKWSGNNNVCLLSLLKVWMEGWTITSTPLLISFEQVQVHSHMTLALSVSAKLRLAVLFTSIRPHLAPIAQSSLPTVFPPLKYVLLTTLTYILITMVLHFLRRKKNYLCSFSFWVNF